MSDRPDLIDGNALRVRPTADGDIEEVALVDESGNYVAAGGGAATPWLQSPQPTVSSTAVAIKATAGTLGGYYFYNPNSSAIYVQLFNLVSTSVTVGTTAPNAVYGVPATSGANLNITNGVGYSAAITAAATTTPTGGVAPASPVVATFLYL